MIGVAIGTYGDVDVWGPLALIAYHSAYDSAKGKCRVMWSHGETLAHGRNTAAEKLIEDGCDWLVFLDADDSLDREFIDRMSRSLMGHGTDPYNVFRPSTQGIIDGVVEAPQLGVECSLLQQNFMPIGCMHSAALFQEIGGFDEWPVLEDWAYWLKAWVAGAKFRAAPKAVYRIHEVTGRARRNFGDSDSHNAIARSIRENYTKIAKEAGLV